MAFYTALNEQELQAMLQRYGIDALDTCTGASDGIENTTYFLRRGAQQWILTLFEDLSAAELPFFARLMLWLHEKNLPVACPLLDSDGNTQQTLSNKPALLFPRLAGQHPRTMTLVQCAAIGDFLGRMHAVSAQYPEQRSNPRGTAWMQAAQQRLAHHLNAEDTALLAAQIDNAKILRALPLPTGLVHGDLFHDNALFDGEHLCGVIDFYNACTDLLAWDLAIVINDWCAQADGGVDAERSNAILSAYTAQRALTALEREHWSAILQLAAARFWLSRLLAEKLPARAGVQHAHKPSAEYRARLQWHVNHC